MAQIKNVTTPDLGGAADVTVIEVLVKPGDKIEKDASIVVLESDKATLDVPSAEAGVVKEVKVKAGDKVSTGSVLLSIETSGSEAEAPPPAPPPAPVEEKVLTGTVQSTNDVHAGPGVRRLARELGVNLALVPGSGPKQRVVKEDVQAYVKTQLSQLPASTGTGIAFPPAPQVDFTKFGPINIQALSRIKKISGKNLQRNWMMIPHVTQFGEADITSLEEFRLAQKNELEKQKVKLTPLVFIMKGVVASLKAFPSFNASLDASGENLVLKNYFHIGVAVDTPDGLVVPVIRDVDKKGLV
ncbi:MAG: hypothetical protein EPO11_06180, partial [Gammaproteobacteria bacterium]